MEIDLTVGEKLADLRKSRGMTLNDVAEQSGLSPSTISDYENDTYRPTAKSMVKLLSVYGVTIDEFYGFDWSDYQKDLEIFKKYGFSKDFFEAVALYEKYSGHEITKCLNLLFEPPFCSLDLFENLLRAFDPALHEELANLSVKLLPDASMRFLLEPVFTTLTIIFHTKYPEFSS